LSDNAALRPDERDRQCPRRPAAWPPCGGRAAGPRPRSRAGSPGREPAGLRRLRRSPRSPGECASTRGQAAGRDCPRARHGPARDRKKPLPADGGILLATERLSAGYGVLDVIRDVDIGVEKGELVAVLGANGAGKSTLMSALSGLNRPIGGRVLFLGRRIESFS